MQSWAKWIVTVLLLALVGLSWGRHLDDASHAATLTNFKRALAVAAIARGFNGVISVAQGTEIAVQPLGVGVTLTIGEILDPLNDLIERFSVLALLASVSLGIQLSLGQMVASVWLSAIMSGAVLTYLVMLWRTPGKPDQQASSVSARAYALRFMGAFIFLRFLPAVVLITTHFIDTAFLADRQDQAVARLASTANSIQQLPDNNAEEPALSAPENSLFDATAAQIRGFLDDSSQALDLKAQLAQVEKQVESSVEEVINLIVIFFLQTLLLPIASLWLCWWSLRAFWQWSKTPPTGIQTDPK